VCQKPYEGFYLGCESCEGWFHPPCIGLSETEANRFDTNPDAVFLCPECSGSSNGGGKSKGKKKDEVVKEKAEASKSTTPLKVKDTE
jgi:hypothetical protein